MKSVYTVVGAMAGSSMDGLDLALIRFNKYRGDWNYTILKTEIIPYELSLYQQLKLSKHQSRVMLTDLDLSFGKWIGERINLFLKNRKETIDLLAIHGHTASHSPKDGISYQLGSGEIIATETGIATVTDFRSLDVSLGGEGAPLVPFGDFMLFKEYNACLNLGGIANVSYRNLAMAWDICPCNQVLNHFSRQVGFEYDENGDLSLAGKVNERFISEISKVHYFSKKPPKSLPNEFISNKLLNTVSPHDGLRSYCIFIAHQIAKDLSFVNQVNPKILVTGGGAFNHFLVSEIKKELNNWEVVIPGKTLISFKEALIFGFLGLKRLLNEINVLSSVTGSYRDTSSGTFIRPYG